MNKKDKQINNNKNNKTRNKIKFGKQLFNADIRKKKDLKPVLHDNNYISENDETPAYFMYRNLFISDEDRIKILQNRLRYDITVIPPDSIGKEFTKTYGHYHKIIPGTTLTYPEMYQVIEGKASFLIQKNEDEKITDVAVIQANKGDIVIVPPNYGHVTINDSDETLKMANWISDKFSSSYKEIEKKQGAAYFKLTNGEFIPNKNYKDLPPLRKIKSPNFKKLFQCSCMYYLIDEPQKLKFLTHPHRYKEIFNFVN